MISFPRCAFAGVAALTLVAAACGSDDEPAASDDATAAEETATAQEPAADESTADESTADESATNESTADEPAADGGEVPTIVVTTNILGDVADSVFGDSAEVVTVMPVGADPHDFQASAQEVDQIMNADALIVNGGGLEEGLLDVIESAEEAGVPTFEALSVVETIEVGEGGRDHGDEDHDDGHSDEDEGEDHDHSDEEHADEDKDEDHEHSDEEEHADEEHADEEHSDEEHADEDHDHSDEEEHSDEEHSDEDKDEEHDHSDEEEHADDDHAHDHSGADPHFWLDPVRMIDAVNGMVVFVQGEIEFADASALEASAAAYVAELDVVDAESEAQFETIPEENKVLVTNHDSLGYFADRYGFEIAGAVIPGGSTQDGVDPGELAELAELIEELGVPAIFADNSASDELARVLADEVGEVEVVQLYTGSLGEPGSDGDTYLKMMSANAERVTAALS